jgi:N-acyl homoserine lactone hydrolase
MKKYLLLGLMSLGLVGAAPAPDMKLWRLDCGTISVSDFGIFSDAGAYRGEKRDMVDSCYLIKHGNDYMLWDSGLSAELKGQKVTDGPFTVGVEKTIVEQLAEIGVAPEKVTIVGLSHYHDDHTGQARHFPEAKLLMGKGDLEAFKAMPAVGGRLDRARLKPWLDDGAPSEGVGGDKDVFGDGSVMMLNMTGHTPGHHVLLVNLPKTGPVLLSGDQFHAQSSFDAGEVPIFNTDRADTLASHDRFKRLARNLKATIVIQHEPADVKKLPVFPKAAE